MQMQVVKEKREEKLERPIYGAEHFGLIFCVALYMTDSTLHNHPESQMNAFMEGLFPDLDDEDNSDYEDDQFTSGWFVMDFPSPSIPMTYSMNLTLSLKCSSSANIYIFTDFRFCLGCLFYDGQGSLQRRQRIVTIHPG